MPDVLRSSSTASRALDRVRAETSSLRRWLRNASSRESVLSTLKTLAWVAPLTVLIWVYAEREQLYSEAGVSIPIDVISGDPTRVVTLIRPPEKMVMADLEGPRSRVEFVQSELSRNERPASIKIVVDPKYTSGQAHDISARPMLEKDALFDANGVKVTACQPPMLTVFVDTYQDVELPVEPPPSMTNLGVKTFQPAKVHLRAPSKEIDKVRANGPLVAYADLASVEELRTPGEHDVPVVRIFVPGLNATENVTISPAVVKASVDVRQADITFTIRTVPINVSGPAFLMKQYRVVCDDSVANIKVVGPPSVIEMISKGAVKPTAVLEITPDDAPMGSAAAGVKRSKTLRYDLPKEVRVAADDAQRTVDFTLVERASDQ